MSIDPITVAEIERAYPACLRQARIILHNDGDAEDAVQQALLLAWLHQEEFKGECAWKTWMQRITINCALAIRRAPWHRLRDSLPPRVEFVSPIPGPEHDYRQGEFERLVWGELARIPPFLGRPLERRLRGIIPATQSEKMRVYRAKHMLRERLVARGVHARAI